MITAEELKLIGVVAHGLPDDQYRLFIKLAQDYHELQEENAQLKDAVDLRTREIEMLRRCLAAREHPHTETEDFITKTAGA